MEVSSSSPAFVVRSEFPAQCQSLAEIAQFVRQAAMQAGLDESVLYSIETAVDEACSNIIEHAYKGVTDGTIWITCSVNPGEIVIELRDIGKPFKPSLVKKPRVDVPLKKRKDNGLGLYFINSLMDEVVFNFDPHNGNTLTLRKKAKLKSPDLQ